MFPGRKKTSRFAYRSFLSMRKVDTLMRVKELDGQSTRRALTFGRASFNRPATCAAAASCRASREIDGPDQRAFNFHHSRPPAISSGNLSKHSECASIPFLFTFGRPSRIGSKQIGQMKRGRFSGSSLRSEEMRNQHKLYTFGCVR